MRWKSPLNSVVAVLMLLLISGVGLRTAHTAESSAGQPVMFGLTPVVVRENLRFLEQWSKYLSRKVGRPIQFVRRRSYREIMDLLESGDLDFAWICGFPFIQKREPEFIELMSVPVYRGKPLYHSYIIVHKDSPHRSFEDLKGKVFAFSDPDSNSGFLYPQYLLAGKSTDSETYFRHTFFTFNHAETVEAVAERVASGGAVDSYIWDYINASSPLIAEKTRIVMTSPAFGFPPLVMRIGVDARLARTMKSVLMDMSRDPDGRTFLDGLKLDGFGDFPPSLFDSIREMSDKTGQELSGLTTVPNVAVRKKEDSE